MTVRLCTFAEIPDGAARGFIARGGDGFPLRLVIVRQGDRLYAYHNSCPHRRLPLDFDDGRFLNRDGSLLLCTNHGALFRPADGRCVAGPCVGAALTPVALSVVAGEVYVTP